MHGRQRTNQQQQTNANWEQSAATGGWLEIVLPGDNTYNLTPAVHRGAAIGAAIAGAGHTIGCATRPLPGAGRRGAGTAKGSERAGGGCRWCHRLCACAWKKWAAVGVVVLGCASDWVWQHQRTQKTTHNVALRPGRSQGLGSPAAGLLAAGPAAPARSQGLAGRPAKQEGSAGKQSGRASNVASWAHDTRAARAALRQEGEA